MQSSDRIRQHHILVVRVYIVNQHCILQVNSYHREQDTIR